MSNQSVTKEVFSKIARLVPGFRSYSKKEDLRHNDLLIRRQMEIALGSLSKKLASLASRYLDTNELDKASIIMRLKDDTTLVEDSLKFASRGYSSIFQTIEINEELLIRIAQHDERLMDMSVRLKKDLIDAGLPESLSELEQFVQSVRGVHEECRAALDKRSEVMKGLS